MSIIIINYMDVAKIYNKVRWYTMFFYLGIVAIKLTEQTLPLMIWNKRDVSLQSEILLSDRRLPSIYAAGGSLTHATIWKDLLLLYCQRLLLETFIFFPARTIFDVSKFLHLSLNLWLNSKSLSFELELDLIFIIY